ncbi:malto-oligosyltrehalose trehalohydrolase [bacterium]|nr:malto-oligosyltrehalose trehalohydrolase [bacterium]
MEPLRIWAPDAREVEAEMGDAGTRRPLEPASGGWWELPAGEAPAGTRYRLRIDGEGPFPDPRSPWQPDGVHGPSCRLDHAAYPWQDTGWQPPPLASGVVYELHVGTFTAEGTFEAAIDRLDHLVALGVTHVELMPVAAFPGHHGWGYDGVDLFAPHEPYGGPEGLKRLVDACHGRGLAVIMDVVYNHLGPDGNYLRQFGPYFTDRYGTPWGEAVNLDGAGSDEVRRFFCDNAAMWLRDYHCDGLRIDAVHAFHDRSAVHLLEQLADEVDALAGHLGRPLVLIAESDLNDPRLIRPREVGGYGLTAQWNEDFHHALHALLTGERDGYYADFGTADDLVRVLTRGFAYDGRYSRHRGRRHGRPADDRPGTAFVACLQNHDQIGNRARGDRTSELLTDGQLRIGAAIVLTSPMVPMLYQGEEWAASTPFPYFCDHQDEQLAESVRRGRREEFAAFGWDPETIPDPQAASTVASAQLDWQECARDPHVSILEWHRELIALRRRLPELRDGRLDRVRVEVGPDDAWLVVHRGPTAVVCNLAGGSRTIPLAETGARELLLASPGVTVDGRGMTVPEHGVAIARLNRG